MYPDEPQRAISSVLDAPRELAFRAFTDPHHLDGFWLWRGRACSDLAEQFWATVEVRASKGCAG
ncbi:MAG TPA: hypothetical protein VMS00_10520 [Acidimicrobiales bacterium]|nr:hypothetical protein [Acidimicrobiales bacterium]